MCCLNFYEFRLNLFFFSPLTLAATVIVSHEQTNWDRYIFNLLPAQVQLDNNLDKLKFQTSGNFIVTSTIGFVMIMNFIGYIRQLDVCVLHCEISKSSKQDDSFKSYLKNKTDGIIVFALTPPDQTCEVAKIEIKMVNEVFIKLTEINNQVKPEVGGQYLIEDLDSKIFKIDEPDKQENQPTIKLR